MRRAARIDLNHREIVDALRDIGASVESLASVGKGCPDILVGYCGINYLIEIKSTGGKKTEYQKAWHDKWRGAVNTVYSADEAVEIITRS